MLNHYYCRLGSKSDRKAPQYDLNTPARRTELFSYEQSIFYTIIAAVIALPRTELKAKVVDAPEVLHSTCLPSTRLARRLAGTKACVAYDPAN
jgi:hypothetical protein